MKAIREIGRFVAWCLFAYAAGQLGAVMLQESVCTEQPAGEKLARGLMISACLYGWWRLK